MQLLISSGSVPILSCLRADVSWQILKCKLRTSKENAISIFKICKQFNQPQVGIN